MAKGAGLLERLLRIVSFYRKVTVLASGSDAEEIMENLFDSICSLLMSPTTRRAFLEVEGIDLMVSILKCKQSRVRGCALKVLSYALGPPSAHAAVLAFVNALGLKSFFPAFLKSPSKSESEYEGKTALCCLSQHSSLSMVLCICRTPVLCAGIAVESHSGRGGQGSACAHSQQVC